MPGCTMCWGFASKPGRLGPSRASGKTEQDRPRSSSSPNTPSATTPHSLFLPHPHPPSPHLMRGVGLEPGNLRQQLLNIQHRLTTQQVDNSKIIQPVTFVSFFFFSPTRLPVSHFEDLDAFPRREVFFFFFLSEPNLV